MIRPLTSLRFFFAFIVAFSHLKFLHQNSNPVFRALHLDLLMDGHLGVSFFFILSGFILAHSYQDRLLSGEITNREFWIGRFARLYPLHALTLLLALPYSLFGQVLPSDHWLPVLSGQLTLTQAFVPRNAIFFSLNSPAWSISAEAFFYLLFPFLVLLFCGRKKTLLQVLFALAVVAIPVSMFFVKGEVSYWLYYINPLVRVVDFAMGILLFSFHKQLTSKWSRQTWCWSEIISVLLLFAFIALQNKVPAIFRLSCFYWLPMCLVILSFSFQQGWLSILLSRRVFVRLGEISFAFYLIHLLVIQYAEWLNYCLHITDNLFVLSVAILVVSLCLSYFLHKYVERPCNAWIKNKCRQQLDRKYETATNSDHQPVPEFA
jgi:peptidoglycan/LPS O-acetylase OafA/YrhL